MLTATVSAKGQITLPSKIRNKLGLKPLDRVLIELDNEKIVIRKANLLDYAGCLGKALSPEEERKRMMQGVADHIKGTRLKKPIGNRLK